MAYTKRAREDYEINLNRDMEYIEGNVSNNFVPKINAIQHAI
jgi:hypothetical protein